MDWARRTSIEVIALSGFLAAGCGGSDQQPADHPASGGEGGSAGGGGSGGSGGGSGGSGAGQGGSSTNGGTGPSGGSGPRGGAAGAAECEPDRALPDGVPELEPGVWTDITPPGIPKGDPEQMIAQGISLDRCNPGTVYWGNTPYDTNFGGVYRSTDAGATWTKLGDPDADEDGHDAVSTYLDEPLHVYVDPDDPRHLYGGSGVRGGTLGFWVSWDSGETWTKSAQWMELARTIGFIDDIYDVAVNPEDFNHVLVSSHSAWKWDSPEYGQAAGILESRDGGETWTVHDPELSWGYGHSINFLYSPEHGIGDANTWLLGTQGDGYWRTTNAGETWTKVSEEDMFHGGGTTYYSRTGVLYVSAYPQNLRSEDNGETFERVSPGHGYTCVFGDGETLYTGPAYGYGEQPFFVSPEDDGRNWTPYAGGAQTWDSGGPFEMAYDSANRLLYSSNWFRGVWVMKVPEN